MVLWPEIVDAARAVRRRCSRRAASAPVGRSPPRWRSARPGVWMGSAFLTAAEYDLGHRKPSGVSTIQEALLRATSSDTVRRRIYTGKPARLSKSRWTEAWDAPDAPEPLPMPLQNILVSEAHQRMNESDDPDTVAMPVGQIVGPDERNPPRRRHHRRTGQGIRGRHQATRRHPGKVANSASTPRTIV